MKVLDRIRKDFSIIGLNIVWTYIIKVLNIVFKKMINIDVLIVTQRPLTKTIVSMQTRLNVTHKLINAYQMGEIIEGKYEFEREERFNDLKHVYQTLREEFTNNRSVCVSMVNNKIVAWKWLNFEHIYIRHLNLKIKLPDKHVYFYDVYTVPSYRGKKIQPAASEYIFNTLRAQGITGCFGLTTFANLPSIACQKTSGWSKKGNIYVVKFNKKKRIYFSRRLQKVIRGNLSSEITDTQLSCFSKKSVKSEARQHSSVDH